MPGQNSNQLQPDNPASRLWVSQMAVRALGLEDQAKAMKGANLPFKDASAVPADMAGYIKIAAEKVIFAGYPIAFRCAEFVGDVGNELLPYLVEHFYRFNLFLKLSRHSVQ